MVNCCKFLKTKRYFHFLAIGTEEIREQPFLYLI